MMRSAIASRLIAIESALRTRASLNGFLSSGLPSFGGDERRGLVAPLVQVHVDHAVGTLSASAKFLSEASFAMSEVGTVSIICTSPDEQRGDARRRSW